MKNNFDNEEDIDYNESDELIKSEQININNKLEDDKWVKLTKYYKAQSLSTKSSDSTYFTRFKNKYNLVTNFKKLEEYKLLWNNFEKKETITVKKALQQGYFCVGLKTDFYINKIDEYFDDAVKAFEIQKWHKTLLTNNFVLKDFNLKDKKDIKFFMIDYTYPAFAKLELIDSDSSVSYNLTERESVESFNKTWTYVSLKIRTSTSSKIGGLITTISRIKSKYIDLHNERNVEALHIGYPFVEGIIKRNTSGIFRAPLFLWKVEVERNPSYLKFKIIKDSPILNNALFANLSSENNLNYSFTDLDPDLFKNGEDSIKQYIVNLFKEINCGFNDEQFHFLIKSLDLDFALDTGIDSKQEHLDYYDSFEIEPSNKIYMKNFCAFGIYDLSKSTIFSIYNELEKKELEPFYKDIFTHNSSMLLDNAEYEEQENEINKKKQDLVLISDLDESQKRAVVNSLGESSTIWGPPGTGKSQTLLNLLANVLNKNESAILITEKRVASDVIFNKLDKLNHFVFRLYDKKLKYKELNQKLEEAIIRINTFYKNSSSNQKDYDEFLDNYKKEYQSILTSKVEYNKFINSTEFNEYLTIKDKVKALNLTKIIDEFNPFYLSLSDKERLNSFIFSSTEIIKEIKLELSWKIFNFLEKGFNKEAILNIYKFTNNSYKTYGDSIEQYLLKDKEEKKVFKIKFLTNLLVDENLNKSESEIWKLHNFINTLPATSVLFSNKFLLENPKIKEAQINFLSDILGAKNLNTKKLQYEKAVNFNNLLSEQFILNIKSFISKDKESKKREIHFLSDILGADDLTTKEKETWKWHNFFNSLSNQYIILTKSFLSDNKETKELKIKLLSDILLSNNLYNKEQYYDKLLSFFKELTADNFGEINHFLESDDFDTKNKYLKLILSISKLLKNNYSKNKIIEIYNSQETFNKMLFNEKVLKGKYLNLEFNNRKMKKFEKFKTKKINNYSYEINEFSDLNKMIKDKNFTYFVIELVKLFDYFELNIELNSLETIFSNILNLKNLGEKIKNKESVKKWIKSSFGFISAFNNSIYKINDVVTFEKICRNISQYSLLIGSFEDKKSAKEWIKWSFEAINLINSNFYKINDINDFERFGNDIIKFNSFINDNFDSYQEGEEWIKESFNLIDSLNNNLYKINDVVSFEKICQDIVQHHSFINVFESNYQTEIWMKLSLEVKNNFPNLKNSKNQFHQILLESFKLKKLIQKYHNCFSIKNDNDEEIIEWIKLSISILTNFLDDKETDNKQCSSIKIKNKDELQSLFFIIFKNEYEKDNMNFIENYPSMHKQLNDLEQKFVQKSADKLYKSVGLRIWRTIKNDDNINYQFNSLSHYYQAGKMKRVKTLFRDYYDLIKILFPIIMSDPINISNLQLFPLRKNEFDFAIFDEASQIFFYKTIPVLYRAKKHIVSGDGQQMPPSRIFERNNAIDENLENFNEENIKLEGLEDYCFENLLEYSKFYNNGKENMLEYHYRSEYEELIAFSNSKFYKNKLQVINKQKETDDLLKPLNLFQVEEGHWNGKINPKEAEKVLELIIDLTIQYPEKTIGVITFNATQQDYIKDLLEEESIKNTTIYEQMERTPTEALFVKNIENVQGDERDIIIFSISYSRKADGSYTNQYGSLSKANGQKRLNVAITRAKSSVYIVKSLSNELIKSSTQGVQLLKEYLDYIEWMQDYDSNQDKVKLLLKKSTNDFSTNWTLKSFDSEYEKEIFDFLVDKFDNNSQLEIRNQISVLGYHVDLAIFDTKYKKYILGIECDGAAYHTGYNKEKADHIRQLAIEQKGWKIERILSTHWWHVNKLKNEFINNVGSIVAEYLENYKID